MAKTTDRQIVNGQEYMIMDSKARSNIYDLNTITKQTKNGIVLSQFSRISEEATYTKTEGQGWIDNGQSLYPNTNWTAFEITDVDVTKEYKIIGINIGSSSVYSVYMLDENNETIKSYLEGDMELISSHTFILIPVTGCSKIRYTTYKNSTWDKAPEVITGYKYNEYDDIDRRVRASIGSGDQNRHAFNSQFERIPVKIDNYSMTTGHGWINNGQTLYPNVNWTAFEITDVDTDREYQITGINIGSMASHSVYLLNSEGVTIAALSSNDLEIVATNTFVVSPIDGTSKIRYTTYKNSTWDKVPLIIEYRPKESQVLPSYYYEDDYFSDKIEEIKRATDMVNGVSFIFITDVHLYNNAGNSKYMMKEILNKTSVPFVVCGGDIVYAYGSAASMYGYGDQFIDMVNYIGKDKFFSVRGNHDFTIKTNSSMESGAPNTGTTFPVGVTYNYMMRNQERFVEMSDPENMAWYIDIPSQKTRIVGINSCDGQTNDETASWGVYEIISQNQVDWILSKALDKTDYRYVFVSHVASDPDLGGYYQAQYVIQAIIEALKNHSQLNYSDQRVTATADFTGYTSVVVCHICGHNHSDESHVANNVLSIMTTCDAAYADDGYGAEIGTITEQAFDVFCIDYDEQKIKAIRMGRGNNRTWNM